MNHPESEWERRWRREAEFAQTTLERLERTLWHLKQILDMGVHRDWKKETEAREWLDRFWDSEMESHIAAETIDRR